MYSLHIVLEIKSIISFISLFYQDLLEGSKDYQSLIAKAEEYYISHRNSMHCEHSTGQEILTLLGSIENDIEEFKKAESGLPPPDGKLILCAYHLCHLF